MICALAAAAAGIVTLHEASRLLRTPRCPICRERHENHLIHLVPNFGTNLMTLQAKADRCRCGRMPGVRTRRVAEDAVATWVQCAGCGAVGPEIEDADRDDATAVASWNAGKGRKW